MHQVKAHLKGIRLSAQKARLVVDQVRGKPVSKALEILRFLPQKSASYVLKCLNSAMANAEHNFNMDVDDLFIAEIFVNQGACLKRIKPRAKGRADRITKPTSHVTVVVEPYQTKRDS